MPKQLVTVNFNVDPPTVAPPMVIVNKGIDDGIEWRANAAGYTFVTVSLDVGPDLTDDFKNPVVGTYGGGPNPKSNLTVDDALTLPPGTEIDYKYTLRYEYMDGKKKKTGFIDPTIRNKR